MILLFCGIVLFILLLLPLAAYLTGWSLSANAALFPRPLKDAKEILLIVAHPDDECVATSPADLTIALFFAPSMLRSLSSGQTHASVLVLSAGMSFYDGMIQN